MSLFTWIVVAPTHDAGVGHIHNELVLEMSPNAQLLLMYGADDQLELVGRIVGTAVGIDGAAGFVG
jgi:hypothetical protein